MMLATPDRARLLLESVASLVEAQPPLAIHWCTTGKFEEPGAFLAELAGADRVRRAINVRLFELPEGELVMDTLGLCALGMLDMQVHFKGLDLEEATRFWCAITDIPASQVRKPYRAEADPTIRLNKHTTGCAYVTYSCTRTHRAVMGLVSALLSCPLDLPG